jgi:hypothetical protein
MSLEDLTPATIADCCGLLGRADDVGEQNRRKHAIGLGAPSHARQELLDLVEDLVLVAEKRQMVFTG